MAGKERKKRGERCPPLFSSSVLSTSRVGGGPDDLLLLEPRHALRGGPDQGDGLEQEQGAGAEISHRRKGGGRTLVYRSWKASRRCAAGSAAAAGWIK